MLLTGVRKGELCGLNWEDFDIENKRVYIKRSYESISTKGLILGTPKTKSSIRNFELSRVLIDLYQEYKIWYDKMIERFPEGEYDSEALFIGNTGKRIHPTSMRNYFDEVLQLAGVKYYPVHSLRHTNVTLLIAAGVPPVTVASRGGHRKISTTLNIYAESLVPSDKEASDRINNYFSERKQAEGF